MAGVKRELDDSAEPEYVVETLVARSVSLKKKNVSYLVKWAGYEDDFNTWEPYKDNIENCNEVVEFFETTVAEARGRDSSVTAPPPIPIPLYFRKMEAFFATRKHMAPDETRSRWQKHAASLHASARLLSPELMEPHVLEQLLRQLPCERDNAYHFTKHQALKKMQCGNCAGDGIAKGTTHFSFVKVTADTPLGQAQPTPVCNKCVLAILREDWPTELEQKARSIKSTPTSPGAT